MYAYPPGPSWAGFLIARDRSGQIGQPLLDAGHVHRRPAAGEFRLMRGERVHDGAVLGDRAVDGVGLGDAAPDADADGGAGQRVEELGQVGVAGALGDGAVEVQVVFDQFLDGLGGLGGVAQRPELDDLVRVYALGGHCGGGGFQDAADLQDFQHRVFAAVQVQEDGQSTATSTAFDSANG